MQRRFYNPLWTHIPALAVWLFSGIMVFRAFASADSVLVHSEGTASLRAAIMFALGIAGVTIVLSAITDESFTRREMHKRFNWFSLWDEVVAALMGAMAWHMVDMVTSEHIFMMSWLREICLVGVAVVAGVLVELKRPFVPKPAPTAPEHIAEETAGLELEIETRLRSGDEVLYAETQRQRSVWAAIAVFGSASIAGGVIAARHGDYFALATISLLVPILIVACGSLRVVVTRHRLKILRGFIAVPALHLPIADISGIEVMAFHPLHEFGGYGIRYDRQTRTRVYVLGGTHGVKLAVRDHYIMIGSDHPDRLAAALRIAMRSTCGGEHRHNSEHAS